MILYIKKKVKYIYINNKKYIITLLKRYKISNKIRKNFYFNIDIFVKIKFKSL